LNLTDVPTFGSVSENLSPGLSVQYHAHDSNLQFDFDGGGVDVAAVGMSFEGVSETTVDSQGQLLLQTRAGHRLIVQAPTLFQTAADGTRQVWIAGGYTVHADGTVGFHVDAAYDSTRELIMILR